MHDSLVDFKSAVQYMKHFIYHFNYSHNSERRMRQLFFTFLLTKFPFVENEVVCMMVAVPPMP